MSKPEKRADYTGCGWIIILGVISIILITIGKTAEFLEGTVIGYFLGLIILFWIFSLIFDN